MAISLLKGGSVSLSKASPNLKNIQVILGWETNKNSGADFDLDVSLFLLGQGGKVINDDHFIFYNNRNSPCGAVVHQGDNRTGTEGEEILINLEKISSKVSKVVFSVSIHEAKERNQNFGQINNAYISIVNQEGNKEIARYELNKDASEHTRVNFGELYKEKSSWEFKAIGEGFEGGLFDFCKQYGVSV